MTLDAASWPMTLALGAVFILLFVIEMMLVERLVFRILILLDKALNALAWGDPRETISARAARARRFNKRWGCVLCKALEWIDPGHCRESGIEQPAHTLALLARRLQPITARAVKSLRRDNPKRSK